MKENYISSIQKQFAYYRMLGEKTFGQVSDEQLFLQANEASNSIGIIVKHLWGNMLSRWTDFYTTDGEKEWRARDAEFEADIQSREELMQKWNEGWDCLFDTINSLTDSDLDKIIYIRNQGHTVTEAINRQFAHYAYHVGQIVFLGVMLQGENWQSLSIAKNQSSQFNADKFAQEKKRGHFTDEFLEK